MEAENGVMHVQAKEQQRLPATPEAKDLHQIASPLDASERA